jgi:prophage antirepressor-like protein
MKDLQVFENSEFGSLTVIEKDGEPWFIGKEVATALGYTDTDQAIRNHCKYVELLKPVDLTGLEIPPRGFKIVNEKDVYRLIMRSKLDSAEKFQDWVMDEVLPTIRKTGGYLAPEIDWTDLDKIQQILDVAKEERKKRLEAETILIENKPKVEYYEKVLDTDTAYTVTQLAKENGMTARQLNLVLNECGVQFKQSGQWMLYKKYQDKGLVKTRTYVVNRSEGGKETKHSTTWTEKGREFVRELLEDI